MINLQVRIKKTINIYSAKSSTRKNENTNNAPVDFSVVDSQDRHKQQKASLETNKDY